MESCQRKRIFGAMLGLWPLPWSPLGADKVLPCGYRTFFSSERAGEISCRITHMESCSGFSAGGGEVIPNPSRQGQSYNFIKIHWVTWA